MEVKVILGEYVLLSKFLSLFPKNENNLLSSGLSVINIIDDVLELFQETKDE